MCQGTNPFKRSVAIVHSFFLAVFIFFIAEPSILLNIIKNPHANELFLKIVTFILFCARVVLISGLLGMLVDIISGQEDVLTRARFRENIRLFWKKYLFLQAVIFFIHFCLFMVMGSHVIPLKLIAGHVNFLLLYIIAVWIIREKYIKPQGLKAEKHSLSLPSVFMLAFLSFGGIILEYISNYFFFPSPFYSNLAALGASYLYVVFFVYVATLIINSYPRIRQQFKSERELILVNPQWGGIPYGLTSIAYRLYPLLFLILKALTPSHYHIREFNRILWHSRYYKGNCLVAITCYSSNSAIAYRIAKGFKKKGATVVMGGAHVNFMAHEALEFCDSVVIGEVESVWGKVIKDYEKGNMQRIYQEAPEPHHNQEIMARHLQVPPQILKDCVQVRRGCKFNCDFCVIPRLYGKGGDCKPIDQVVALVKKITTEMRRTPVIAFLDNNIYADPAFAKELFRALKPYGLRWSTSCTVDIGNDAEALKLAKESGLRYLLVGYEIDPRSSQMDKGGKLSLAKRYVDLTRKIKKAGIVVEGHFIIGFLSDSWKTFLRLWFSALRIFPHFSGVALLTPFPGTKLYDDLLEDDRLINMNWRNYSAMSLVFDHPKMNNFLLNKAYTVYYIIFYLTTCHFGFYLLFIFIVV